LTLTLLRCVEADAFKLYIRFLQDEGSGVAGVALTVVAYAGLAILAAYVFYVYLLGWHLNGRFLDLYTRLQAEPGALFAPNDFEVSPAEVQWVCAKTERWRGPRGETRRVTTEEVTLRDADDPAFAERSYHLRIHTVGVNGDATLYRHFLGASDGTFIELFGSDG
jgi:hypothetical protein